MTGPATMPLIDTDPEAILASARKGRAGGILIAGAGIGGLATALALAKRGIPSHILERRKAFEEAGAGIQIGPNGTRILMALGVADSLAPLVGRPQAIQVRDAVTGSRLARLPLGRWIEQRYGAPYWTLHRKDLHAALLARTRADPMVKLSMSAEVSGSASGIDGVAVATSDGRVFAGEALIGCDGLWSQVRNAPFTSRTPSFTPSFTGHVAARCVIAASDAPPGFDNTQTQLWLSPHAHAVHYPVCDGRDIAVVVIGESGETEASTDWNSPSPEGFLEPVIASFAPELRALLERAPAWRTWALHTLPAPRKLARERIALLGDAAHPVLPFLAQGGVLALEDAAVLARCIATRPADVAGALADYSKQRRPRAVRVARASRTNGRAYHLSGPLAAARNFILKSTSPTRLITRYDWLYGWRDK